MSVESIKTELANLVAEGGYTLTNDGYSIADPGKFEREPVEILYFYESMMNGGGDEFDEGWDAFYLSDEEKTAFDIMPEKAVAIIWHTESGFEELEYASEKEFDSFLEQMDVRRGESENDPDNNPDEFFHEDAMEPDFSRGKVVPEEEQELDDLHGLEEGFLKRGEHWHHREEKQKRHSDNLGQSYDELGKAAHGAEYYRQRRYRDMVRSTDPHERKRMAFDAQDASDHVSRTRVSRRAERLTPPIEGPKGTLPESIREAKGRSRGWDVFLNGEWIDTVFDIETDPREVKRSLVNHDGYDPSIVVKKEEKGAKHLPPQRDKRFDNW